MEPYEAPRSIVGEPSIAPGTWHPLSGPASNTNYAFLFLDCSSISTTVRRFFAATDALPTGVSIFLYRFPDGLWKLDRSVGEADRITASPASSSLPSSPANPIAPTPRTLRSRSCESPWTANWSPSDANRGLNLDVRARSGIPQPRAGYSASTELHRASTVRQSHPSIHPGRFLSV